MCSSDLFLRSARQDDGGTPNPVAGQVRWPIVTGTSQSGNFVRSFIALGFNAGEDGRRVFDGANPNIAARQVPLNIRFGVPFSEQDTVFFGAGYEETKITTSAGLPNSYFLFRHQFGQKSNAFPLTIGWQRDNRDSVLSPMAGKYQRANFELSPVGDSRFVRANLQYQQFFQVYGPKFTLMVNAELGYGSGLGSHEYPIFKNFYAGGLGSVRVFEAGSLGPVDVTGSYSGGNRRLNVNARSEAHV